MNMNHHIVITKSNSDYLDSNWCYNLLLSVICHCISLHKILGLSLTLFSFVCLHHRTLNMIQCSMDSIDNQLCYRKITYEYNLPYWYYEIKSLLPGQQFVLQTSSITDLPLHFPPQDSETAFDLVFVRLPPPHDFEHDPMFHWLHWQSTM